MITDDASNSSLISAFIAMALIGGITLTLHTMWRLRHLDLSGTDDDTVTLYNPWGAAERTGQSWDAQ